MEFFRIKKDIPFMRFALVFNAISAFTFLLAIFFLMHRGLHLSIEFTGGTVMQVKYEQAANLNKIRQTISKLGYNDVQVQNFGNSKDVMIRLPIQKGKDGKPTTSAIQSQQVMTALNSQNLAAKLQRVEFVGPQVGE